MQGKGFVQFIAVVLTLICLYQLSFTWVANKVEKDAAVYAKGNAAKEHAYLDSISDQPVYPVFNHTYQYVKENEIQLGLDLKGGMNVTMQISLADLVRALADNNKQPAFEQAVVNTERSKSGDFIGEFVSQYKKLNPNGSLASVFSTPKNQVRIKPTASDDDVIRFLRETATGAIDNSFNILRTRIDKFGVTSPNIQKQEGTSRILIELPGVTDEERVRKLLQGSAKLEFYETYDNRQAFALLENINGIIAAKNKPAKTTATTDTTAKKDTAKTGGLLAQVKKNEAKKDTGKNALGKGAELAGKNPLFTVLTPNVYQGENNQQALSPGPVVGFTLQKDTAKVNAYLQSSQVKAVIPSNMKLLWGVKPREKTKVFELYAIKTSGAENGPVLSGDVISDARNDYDQKGNPEVVMSMNANGAARWRSVTAQASADPQNKQAIAIVLDNQVYSAPTVQNEISGGVSSISGNFTVDDTKDLANVLKSGRLPAPAKIVSEYVVGPSLGAESIQKGLVSSIVGVAVILIFMAMYYSKAGWVANVALVINLFFLMGVTASLGAVLTLPGIAGVVLSLGMSVDANVLIYERIREELAEGKSMRLAIADGYRKAMSSILDSNVTTFLSGLILFIFGSGPIQGFATTLMIGIITSLFAAIFITRIIFEWMLKRDQKITFSIAATQGLFKDSKFDFISGRRKFYAFSSIIIVAGLISMFTKGFSLGVDFQGGRTYVVEFKQDVSTLDVVNSLSKAFDGEEPEVKTYGGSNQVRITTDYLIDDTSPNVEDKINLKLNEGLKKLNNPYEIRDGYKVSPTIANDIRTSAIWAVVFSIVGIFLFVLIRFKRWQFGLASIVALLHDVLVLLSLFSLLSGLVPFSLDIDQAFIAAILTVMGYSINDTVVVFDRVREYIGLHHTQNENLPTVINNALNSTLSRTVITGLCTMLVLIILFFFGGAVLRGFSFAMLIGVIFGTYSSLFVATPFVVEFIRKKDDTKK